MQLACQIIVVTMNIVAAIMVVKFIIQRFKRKE